MAELDKCWFDPQLDPDEDRGALMLQVANRLDTSPVEAYRADMNLAMVRMFESQPVQSLNQYAGRYFAGSAMTYAAFALDDQSTWNVARSVSMTAAAMIGRNKPRARFVTSNGKFKQKYRARKASDWCAGWANESDLYSVTFDALVASMWSDVAGVQIFEGPDNKIHIEKVFGSEIRFDPFDALYGKPRTLYRRRFMGKDKLLAIFGKDKDKRFAIENAQTTDPIGIDYPSGMIRVEEAWHLPSSKKAKDGYHAIVIEGQDGTLLVEEWVKTYFPIVLLHWDKAQTGNYGVSLCAQLEPIQRRINKMLNRWDRASHLMTVPRVAIKRGSKIVKSSLSNLIAGAIEYTDTPPTPLVWPIMPPEYYKMLEDQVQKAYDLPGISRNAAQGQKEAGTTSAVAIRESLDVQQTRIQIYQQTWEGFHCTIFKIAVDLASDIVNDKAGPKKYEVRLPGSGMLSRVDWAALELDEADYEVEIWPVSILPITPQGRLDFVQDMLRSGMWDLARCRAAMQDLDTESAESLENSVYYLLADQLENMLYEGTPAQPDEFTPFADALKMGGQYLADGQIQKAPAKNLDLIRRYLNSLKRIQTKLNQPPAAPNGAPGVPPGAGPLDNAGAPLSPLTPAFAPMQQ